MLFSSSSSVVLGAHLLSSSSSSYYVANINLIIGSNNRKQRQYPLAAKLKIHRSINDGLIFPAATRGLLVVAAAATAMTLVLWAGGSPAAPAMEPSTMDTLSNIPQTLSGDDQCRNNMSSNCKRGRIQRPKSRKAESCTVKCVTTCIRGGAGSPGEGPFNAVRPLVVFKEGFRSRQYCLVECSDLCNLISDFDSRP